MHRTAPVWMVTSDALALMREVDGWMTSSPASSVRLLETRSPEPYGRWPVAPAADRWLVVHSYSTLKLMHDAGRLPPPGGTILYDCEAWPHTPPEEQANPTAFFSLAADLCHGLDLHLIVAPSLSLARKLRPEAASGVSAFLSLGLIEAAATVADGLHVHSQSLVRQPVQFRRFVDAVTDRLGRLDSSFALSVGLSTNPPAGSPTPEQLWRCFQWTRTAVSGYWLNIPRRGRWCPNCRPSRPELASALMSRVNSSSVNLQSTDLPLTPADEGRISRHP